LIQISSEPESLLAFSQILFAGDVDATAISIWDNWEMPRATNQRTQILNSSNNPPLAFKKDNWKLTISVFEHSVVDVYTSYYLV